MNGADGYDSLSLTQLRQSQAALSQGTADAQKSLDGLAAYKDSGRGLNSSRMKQLQTATGAVVQYSALAQGQANEIAARESTITQAQQQRTASIGAFRDMQVVHNQIQAARTDDGSTLTRNLQAVRGGQQIDGTWAKKYSAASLLDAE